jgi:hypothetical protein
MTIDRKELLLKSLEFATYSGLLLFLLNLSIDRRTYQSLVERSKGKCESNLRNENGKIGLPKPPLSKKNNVCRK